MTGRPYLSTPQRPCSLYRIMVLDPRTNYTTITLGYIGETGRMPFTRFIEHLYEQPFGDTIVGHPQVDLRVFAGKDAVVAAEEAAVKAERPLYNYEFNLDNPDRITIPQAIEQRRRREAAKGNPNWQPNQKGDRQPVTGAATAPAVAQSPSHLARWWARRRWPVIGWGALWVTLAALICALIARGPAAGVGDGSWVGAGAALTVVGLLMPKARRRRSR